MVSAPSLGDPLEGTAPPGHEKWWNRLVEKATSDEQRQVIERNKEIISAFAAQFRPEYYVSCWHMNATENAEMWEEYTRGSTEAVAIATTYRALRAALHKIVQIGMVRYIDYSHEHLPSMNMLEYITHKNIDYCYESEVRAVAWSLAFMNQDRLYFADNLFELEGKKIPIFAPPINLVELIQSVVLHPKASFVFAEKIRSICEDANLPKPVSSTFQISGGSGESR